VFPLKLETPSRSILRSESDGQREPVHLFHKGLHFSLCRLVLFYIPSRHILVRVLYAPQPCLIDDPHSPRPPGPLQSIGRLSLSLHCWPLRCLHLLNVTLIIAMSAPREKRVHYERGTKGGKSSHRHSRDSGVGSSSASDRASVGTSPDDDSPFSRQQIENQRQELGAVQEALDAAYEKIKKLEDSKARLNESLAESNKENRLLKRERLELMTKIDFMTEEKRKEKARREPASPRTGTSSASSGSRTERASPPRRLDEPRRIEDSSQAGGRRVNRRESAHEPPPIVPQAPYNSSPNPFTPVSSRPSSGTYIVPIQTPVTYAPAPISYTTAPAFPNSPATSNYPNDGRYHPYPL